MDTSHLRLRVAHRIVRLFPLRKTWNGKLVSPATYQLLTTPKPELGAKTYGYGFEMNKPADEGRDVIGHDGDAPGVCADYALIRDLKVPYTVVVLSNASTMGHAVTETIVSLYESVPTQE